MRTCNFKSILVTILLLLSFGSYADTDTATVKKTPGSSGKLLVFSDVDDTIKISYVTNKLEMVSFSVFRDSLFYGMNKVYQGIAKSYVRANGAESAKFFYVSNGWKPTVAETHSALLNDFSFPNPESYYNRKLKDIIKKYPHKKNVILKIINEQNPSTIVLVGDNGESDPRTYNDIVKLLSEKFSRQGKKVVFHVFIHNVYQEGKYVSREVFPGQTFFSDSADLALKLHEKGLLDSDLTKSIVADVSTQIKNERKNSVYGPLSYPFFKGSNKPKGFADAYQCKAFYSL